MLNTISTGREDVRRSALRQILTARNLSCDIEVDGGIQEKTVPLVVQAGANLLVAGSAIYNQRETVGQALARLRQALSY